MRTSRFRDGGGGYSRGSKIVLSGLIVAVLFGLGLVTRTALGDTATSRTKTIVKSVSVVFDPFELYSTPLVTDDGSEAGEGESGKGGDDYSVVPPVCVPDRPQCRSPYRPPCTPRWPKGPPPRWPQWSWRWR